LVAEYAARQARSHRRYAASDDIWPGH
jgi:hypothetical protein